MAMDGRISDGMAWAEADAKLTTDGRKKADIGDREYRESARTRKLQVDLPVPW